VIGISTQLGVFAVCGAVLLAPMVYVFARLHRHAPQARTTSDLVGTVLGERFGVFAGLIQLAAYLLLAVSFARAATVGPVLAGAPIGWFSVGSIGAVVAVGVVISVLSARRIAWVTAVLAAVGMLVHFYVVVALAAMIAAGNEPRNPDIVMLAAPYVTSGFVGVLAAVLMVVGFEVVTTINRDVRSVGRSMGLALALTAGCAGTVATAMSPQLFGSVHMPSDTPFALLAGAYLGHTGVMSLLVGTLAFWCAGLLMLTFAAVRVAGRLAEQLKLRLHNGARPIGVVAIVGVLLIVDWLWSGADSSKVAGVGPLILLVVYACAAYACARIPSAAPPIAAAATSVLICALIAGVIVIPVLEPHASADWGLRLGIAAGLLVTALAIAVKTGRLPRNLRSA
jgi:amino acid transporter